MAKKDSSETTRTAVDNINDSLTNIEQKVQNNTRPLLWGTVIAIAIVCLVLFYFYGIRQPGIQKANEAIGQADIEMAMGNDSVALAQYMDIADHYGYDAGNRANLNAAILLYKQGDYEKAIYYLDRYKGSDKIVAAGAKSLEGDCYVNLEKYDEALKYFAQAVKISDNNPSYTPTFLLKEATVYMAQGNYAEAEKIYQQIVDEYPQFGPTMNVDVEKSLERAKAFAADPEAAKAIEAAVKAPAPAAPADTTTAAAAPAAAVEAPAN